MKPVYTLAYAVGLGAVCAFLLTGVGHLTAGRVAANREAEKVRNIFAVLGVPVDRRTSSRDLLAAFERDIRTDTRGGLVVYVKSGDSMPGVRVSPDNRRPMLSSDFVAVAVEFEGPGLWGPIRGLLALEGDFQTIRGVSFYHHEETPGLGGEIGSARFQEQFKGKSIADAEGRLGLVVTHGRKATGPNEVDGITGATMTSEKVQSMLTDVIRKMVQLRESHDR